MWQSLSRRFPRQSGEALKKQIFLTDAYQAVFNPGVNASPDQKQIVLADMLANSGFSKITVPFDTSSQMLWFNEGMRAMYASVWKHLSLSPADIRDLENAARFETANSEE